MTEGPKSGTRARASASAEARELALLLACHLESYAPDERAEALDLALALRDSGESKDVATSSDSSPGRESGDADASTRIAMLAGKPQIRRVARKLISSWIENAERIDARIRERSKKWRLERMDRIDRNLIRLATVELELGQTPPRVVMAEAVRLASRFGSEHSASFVNGLVDDIARSFARDPADGDRQ